MATNFEIDDSLVEKAVKLGGHRTPNEAVHQALIEYVQHLEQQQIISLFGKVDYDTDYDYKEQRNSTLEEQSE